MRVDVKVLNPMMEKIGLPKRGSTGSAGMDLVACVDGPVTITPGQRHLFPTGIAMHISDPKFAGFVMSRSGLGAKKGLTVAQGVGLIDSDYTGEIMVMILNTSEEPRVVEPGDRIAQLVFMPVAVADWNQVSDLNATTRGAGGFGSTGIQSETPAVTQ